MSPHNTGTADPAAHAAFVDATAVLPVYHRHPAVPGQFGLPPAQDAAMATLPALRSTRRPAQPSAARGPASDQRPRELSHCPAFAPARVTPVPQPRLSGSGQHGELTRTGIAVDGAHRQPPRKRPPVPGPATELTSPVHSGSAGHDPRSGQTADRVRWVSRPLITRSDRLADMALGANYERDLYRPTTHDDERVAHVLGFLLLSELVLDRDIFVDQTGRVRALGRGRARNTVSPLWQTIRDEPTPLEAGQWLTYLALESRSTTFVWRRLVADGFATKERTSVFRRRPRFVLTNAAASIWARRYLLANVTPDAGVPGPASVLWRGLDALQLTAPADLELPDETRSRLRAEPVPASVEPLLAALTHALDAAATRLT